MPVFERRYTWLRPLSFSEQRCGFDCCFLLAGFVSLMLREKPWNLECVIQHVVFHSLFPWSRRVRPAASSCASKQLPRPGLGSAGAAEPSPPPRAMEPPPPPPPAGQAGSSGAAAPPPPPAQPAGLETAKSEEAERMHKRGLLRRFRHARCPDALISR